MAVRAPGDSGYDPSTGWPPDDSTGVNWDNDVELPGKFPFRWGNTDLPGQFRGGGQGFGPGGFLGNPRLTANPAGPPPGVSLSVRSRIGARLIWATAIVIPPKRNSAEESTSLVPGMYGPARSHWAWPIDRRDVSRSTIFSTLVASEPYADWNRRWRCGGRQCGRQQRGCGGR